VDLVLTDPPYGIKADIEMHKKGGQQYGNAAAPKRHYMATNWDVHPPAKWLLEQIIEKGEHSILWGGNYFGLSPARCFLVWDKDNGSNQFADCELAWTNLDKPVRKIRWLWNGMLQENMAQKEERTHPTQKPLGVIKWCMELVPEASTILDPFAGSCTTAVAAKMLGRKCICIEQSEKYCEVGAKRLEGVYEQRQLLSDWQ
jgi:site-specific DNA-methyltransferase (adenine-specific)/modification methylase